MSDAKPIIHESRVVKVAVMLHGKSLLDDGVTYVEITDDGGGEYVTITQVIGVDEKSIALDPAEWPALFEAIDRMVNECRV